MIQFSVDGEVYTSSRADVPTRRWAAALLADAQTFSETSRAAFAILARLLDEESWARFRRRAVHHLDREDLTGIVLLVAGIQPA